LRPEGPPLNRPGRQAGMKNDDAFERRRRGTGIAQSSSDRAILSQPLMPRAACLYGALETCTGLLVAVCFFLGTPFTWQSLQATVWMLCTLSRDR